MRKLCLFVFVAAGMFIQADEEITRDSNTPTEQTSTSIEKQNTQEQAIEEETSETKTPTEELETLEKQPTQKETSEITPKDFFKPMAPNGHSYGAFRIGYVYQNLYSKQILLKNNESSYNLNSHSAYFGLERGWIGGPKKMLMIGAYLDFGAGNVYYGSIGGVFSLRLLNGWLIPKISLGYQLQHLGLPDDFSQYNIQSGVGTIGVFANIAQGFGVGLEIRGAIPFHMVRLADSYNNPKFDMYSVMVSFNFYDFGI